MQLLSFEFHYFYGAFDISFRVSHLFKEWPLPSVARDQVKFISKYNLGVFESGIIEFIPSVYL